jgi:hypothetical protein
MKELRFSKTSLETSLNNIPVMSFENPCNVGHAKPKDRGGPSILATLHEASQVFKAFARLKAVRFRMGDSTDASFNRVTEWPILYQNPCRSALK